MVELVYYYFQVRTSSFLKVAIYKHCRFFRRRYVALLLRVHICVKYFLNHGEVFFFVQLRYLIGYLVRCFSSCSLLSHIIYNFPSIMSLKSWVSNRNWCNNAWFGYVNLEVNIKLYLFISKNVNTKITQKIHFCGSTWNIYMIEFC